MKDNFWKNDTKAIRNKINNDQLYMVMYNLELFYSYYDFGNNSVVTWCLCYENVETKCEGSYSINRNTYLHRQGCGAYSNMNLPLKRSLHIICCFPSPSVYISPTLPLPLSLSLSPFLSLSHNLSQSPTLSPLSLTNNSHKISLPPFSHTISLPPLSYTI